MIDLSDGLSRDLRHICRESHVGAAVHSSEIPIHPDADMLSRQTCRYPIEHALHDGEDYELLFTTSRGAAVRLLDRHDHGGRTDHGRRRRGFDGAKGVGAQTVSNSLPLPGVPVQREYCVSSLPRSTISEHISRSVRETESIAAELGSTLTGGEVIAMLRRPRRGQDAVHARPGR